jgi:hypothetical protein
MRTQSSTKPLPFFYIGNRLTTERINNFLDQKHSLLSAGMGKTETKSIWYSRDHIARLLEEIDFAGGDGLRIRFGMYEPSHEFADQLCLVMNVTREKEIAGNLVHTNIVLENEPDFIERSALPRESIKFSPKDIFTSRIKDFNYGSPCPPRCGGFDDDGE